MSSAPDDGETYKPLVVKGAGVGNPSELKLKVEVRHDEIALVVKVDGMKLTAETYSAVRQLKAEVMAALSKSKRLISDT